MPNEPAGNRCNDDDEQMWPLPSRQLGRAGSQMTADQCKVAINAMLAGDYRGLQEHVTLETVWLLNDAVCRPSDVAHSRSHLGPKYSDTTAPPRESSLQLSQPETCAQRNLVNVLQLQPAIATLHGHRTDTGRPFRSRTSVQTLGAAIITQLHLANR